MGKISIKYCFTILLLCFGFFIFPNLRCNKAPKEKKLADTTTTKEVAKPQDTVKTSEKIKTEESDEPFNVKLEALTPFYEGNNLENLYDKLNSQFPPKGEFETSDTYNKRIKSFTPLSIYAFPIENFINIHHCNTIEYNADKGTLEIGMFGYCVSNRTHDILADVIFTKRINISNETYTATNAYGATLLVQKKIFAASGIALKNANRFEDMSGHRYIKIKLSAEEARDLKNNLGILLICKLAISDNPISYLFSYNEVKDATYNDPVEWNTVFKCLYAKLLQIWIYNNQTGKIYLKDKVEKSF